MMQMADRVRDQFTILIQKGNRRMVASAPAQKPTKCFRHPGGQWRRPLQHRGRAFRHQLSQHQTTACHYDIIQLFADSGDFAFDSTSSS